MPNVTVLDPTAEPNPIPRQLAERPATLAGKRVGFLNNSKPNVELLFDTIEAGLRDRFELRSVVRHVKPAAAIPTETALLDEMARECDVVISAICD